MKKTGRCDRCKGEGLVWEIEVEFDDGAQRVYNLCGFCLLEMLQGLIKDVC